MRGSGLAAPIMALDRFLRRRQGIMEFCDSRECVFRLQIVKTDEKVVLSDCTAGGRLLDLHLWNEQIPLIPDEGITWEWAQRASQMVEFSLTELACYLKANRDLDDIRVIRGRIGLGAGLGEDRIMRLASRFGFERPRWPKSGAENRLHLLGENILISMLVLARNPASLTLDSLWRSRTVVYLSRNELERRYGEKRKGAGRASAK